MSVLVTSEPDIALECSTIGGIVSNTARNKVMSICNSQDCGQLATRRILYTCQSPGALMHYRLYEFSQDCILELLKIYRCWIELLQLPPVNLQCAMPFIVFAKILVLFGGV